MLPNNARSELLRTQAVTSVLSALGGLEVHTFGHDSWADGCGVFLQDDRTVSRMTYWGEDGGKRVQYEVRVSVDVYRSEVPRKN
ncbi:hypothetical protein ABZ341_41700 [Streptomyces sp. NPDC006173]|uniref:hypothetical protein n=1 Tax=Streptomyces sp. NPDC006173 TaxID=3155349 RepID=UPI0033FC5B9F